MCAALLIAACSGERDSVDGAGGGGAGGTSGGGGAAAGSPGAGGTAGSAGSSPGGGSAGSAAGSPASGGSGGSATAGAGSGVGGGAGTGGAGGAKPVCPPRPDRCAANLLEGNVTVNSAEAAAALNGVTELTGDLNVTALEGLEALDCLETVGGGVELGAFTSDGGLAVLGNLRTVGEAVRVRASSNALVDLTCSFGSLEAIGTALATGRRFDVTGGITGAVDVSTLTSVQHFLFGDSSLTRVVMPSNRALEIGQLHIDGNAELVEVSGFDAIELTPSGRLELRIVDNPQLSTCWANELADRFVAAQATASVTISGNLADCP